MMVRLSTLVIGLFLTGTLFSQIELSEDSEAVKKEKKKKLIEENKKESSVEAFLIANWSSTSRSLIENDAPYGDTLGKRATEGGLNRWSYGLGIRSKINRYLSWEGGISFFQNGESYLFEAADSSYRYSSTYSYISMPLKLLYTYQIKELTVFAGVGLAPQMFMRYTHEYEWTNSVSESGSDKFSTNTGYNSFVLSMVANVGFQLKLGEKMSVMFVPEYRYQISSSYEKQDSFKHFGRALGFNVGLSYSL